jgi:hypothetical protein
MNRKYYLQFFLLLTVILFSCSKKYWIVSKEKYEFKSGTGKPDFSDLNYWAAHPLKLDPSDSVPACIKNEIKDSLADVFFYILPVLPINLTAVGML